MQKKHSFRIRLGFGLLVLVLVMVVVVVVLWNSSRKGRQTDTPSQDSNPTKISPGSAFYGLGTWPKWHDTEEKKSTRFYPKM
ncbi:hypothetical protein M0804_010222 [Polistes exclamans]|nr:hypothetical protein M0804_010222 [Polistes exclamans]